MPHVSVISVSPAGFSAVQSVEFHSGEPVRFLKERISGSLAIPRPLSIFLNGKELDDAFTGLLDGATVVTSAAAERQSSLAAHGCSFWPEELLCALADANAALDAGHAPRLAKEGEGATYFLVASDPSRGFVACFKPQDEEAGAPRNPRRCVGQLGQPSMRSGIFSGEGFVREAAAFVLDHGGFAGVPPTALVTGRHGAFNYGVASAATSLHALPPKVGAFQLFVHNGEILEDFGSPNFFADEEVWKVAILDLRLMNLDRNGENIMVRSVDDGTGGRRLQLIPIDHGSCFPSDLGVSAFDWVWFNWPQLKRPLSDRVRSYVAALDVESDVSRLQALFGDYLRPQCTTTLRISHLLLQRGVARGLTLFDIASLMCRADAGADPATDRSPLERAVLASAHLATHAMHSVTTHVAKRLRAAAHFPALDATPPAALPSLQRTPPFGADTTTSATLPPPLLTGLPVHSYLTRQLSTQPTVSSCLAAVGAWWAARAAAAVPGLPTARVRVRHISDLDSTLGVNSAALEDRHLSVWIAAAFCAEDALMESASTMQGYHGPSRPSRPRVVHRVCLTDSGISNPALQPLRKLAFDLGSSSTLTFSRQTIAEQFGISSVSDRKQSLISSIAVGVECDGQLWICAGAPLGQGVVLVGDDEGRRGIIATLAAALGAVESSDCSGGEIAVRAACMAETVGLIRRAGPTRGSLDSVAGTGRLPTADFTSPTRSLDLPDDFPGSISSPYYQRAARRRVESFAVDAHSVAGSDARSPPIPLVSPLNALQQTFRKAARDIISIEPCSACSCHGTLSNRTGTTGPPPSGVSAGTMAMAESADPDRVTDPASHWQGESRHDESLLFRMSVTAPLHLEPLPVARASASASDSAGESVPLADGRTSTDSHGLTGRLAPPAATALAAGSESSVLVVSSAPSHASSGVGTASVRVAGMTPGPASVASQRSFGAGVASASDFRAGVACDHTAPGPSGLPFASARPTLRRMNSLAACEPSGDSEFFDSSSTTLNAGTPQSLLAGAAPISPAPVSGPGRLLEEIQRYGAFAGAAVLKSPEETNSATVVLAELSSARASSGEQPVSIMQPCSRHPETVAADESSPASTVAQPLLRGQSSSLVSDGSRATSIARVGRLEGEGGWTPSSLPPLPEAYEVAHLSTDCVSSEDATALSLPTVPLSHESALRIRRAPAALSLARSATYDLSNLPRTHALDAVRGLAGQLPSTQGTPMPGAEETPPTPAATPLLARYASETGATSKSRPPLHGVAGEAAQEDAPPASHHYSFESFFLAYLSQQVDELITRTIERKS